VLKHVIISCLYEWDIPTMSRLSTAHAFDYSFPQLFYLLFGNQYPHKNNHIVIEMSENQVQDTNFTQKSKWHIIGIN